MTGLSALFAPRGIVVVGASRAPGKLGTAMTDALRGAPVPVALVHRVGGDGMVSSVNEAVADLAARGATADLVISCVPAAATAAVIRDAGEQGIAAALVCAGGFAETGSVGADAEAALRDAALTGGVRVLGPNTSGFFVPESGLLASFVPGVRRLPQGRVAVVASSGGVNHMLSFRLARAGVGVSIGVGIGGGLGVTHADVLDFLLSHDATTAIALHIENVADGPTLVAAIRRAAHIKPVVALVVGRRPGSAFAESHTGALATSWRTTRAVLSQAGAVVVDDEEQLVAAVTALSRIRLAPTTRPGVGIVTAQAGPGLIIDDHAAGAGWSVPVLAADTQATIAGLLPPMTYQANPVDTGRPGDTFPAILRAVGADPAIDVVAVYALTEPVVDLPRAVADADCPVPILVAMDGELEEVAAAAREAENQQLVFLTGPSALSWAVGAVTADARARAVAAAAPLADGEVLDTSGAWDEARSKDLLDSLGIATPDRRIVTDSAGAERALAELGGPVAVKLVDASILHKTEMGGVVLGVGTPDRMARAIEDLRAVGATRFMVERMADAGVDIVVSARRDPVFGPAVVLGFGGTAAEAVDDVSIGCVPVSPAVVEQMIAALRTRELLFGWRGGPSLTPADLEAVLGRLGTTLAANPALAEIEINPLRLTRHGLVALDAVVITVKEDEDD